jgi:glycosyltransferase involved in cell wall biosynthesis
MSPRSLEFVIPGDLQAATGGYGYDRRLITGLRALGWEVAIHALDASFPAPTGPALRDAQQLFAQLADQALVLVDGLALGAMPQVVQPHAARLRLMALVHHPLAAESGLEPRLALKLARSERLALEAMRHIIVTSHATKQALGPYGIEPGRVSVVEPGTDEAPVARRARGDELEMLCVATLIPRKGHDLLFEALSTLPPRWHLSCAGSLTRSPETVAGLRAQLHALGLEQRIALVGEVHERALRQLYAAADLFVLPTRYEGYGMAVAEALAHGLPVVSTRAGAIPELVGLHAGLLVDADDVDQLRAALERVLNEPGLLSRLATGAERVRSTLPRWQDCCARMSRVLLQDPSDHGGGR